MKIDVLEWKECLISDLFYVSGSTTTPKDVLEEKGPGPYPYVTTAATNNGVDGYYNYWTEKGGVITVESACMGYATFQQNNFSASDHVEILTPKFDLTEEVALFIVTLINNENYRYSYGRKCNQNKIKEMQIRVPLNDDGSINTHYIEEIMKNLHHKKIKTNNNSGNEINVDEWKDYRLDEICNITYGVNLEVVNCEECSNNSLNAIPFVSRTENNNGISTYVVQDDNTPNPPNTISVAGGGSVLSTFYQENEYYSGRDLFYLETKEPTTKYAKLFLCTIIEKNKYKYSYGRQANKTMKDLILKLPSIDGKPDWDFMDQYMRKLPYADRI